MKHAEKAALGLVVLALVVAALSVPDRPSPAPEIRLIERESTVPHAALAAPPAPQVDISSWDLRVDPEPGSVWGTSYSTRTRLSGTGVGCPGIPPEVPPKLQSVDAGLEGVRLEWTADREVRIERRGGKGPRVFVAPKTGWLDATAEPRTRYEYRIEDGPWFAVETPDIWRVEFAMINADAGAAQAVLHKFVRGKGWTATRRYCTVGATLESGHRVAAIELIQVRKTRNWCERSHHLREQAISYSIVEVRLERDGSVSRWRPKPEVWTRDARCPLHSVVSLLRSWFP